jgi:hypothetical protein
VSRTLPWDRPTLTWGPATDERRIHRPLDASDLDLDPADEIDRRRLLLAAVRGSIATLARLAVEFHELIARLRQRLLGGRSMVRHRVLISSSSGSG